MERILERISISVERLPQLGDQRGAVERLDQEVRRTGLEAFGDDGLLAFAR